MDRRRKLITYILVVIAVITFLIIGLMLGDPQDMRIEASTL